MVRLDCSGVHFGSQLDEKHMFEWAMKIPCAVRWDQDTLIVDSLDLSDADLYDLIALFRRYGVSLRQLAQFRSAKNEAWLCDPQKYWHEGMFSVEAK